MALNVETISKLERRITITVPLQPLEAQIRQRLTQMSRTAKFAGFRPRIEGTTSLDGKLNLKMRLGLPPLGIIGIPLVITGNKDNPKVKLGRQTEDLEETKDTIQ